MPGTGQVPQGDDANAELNGPADLAALLAPAGALTGSWVYTPIGGMVAVTSDAGLHLLEFPRRARLQAALAKRPAVMFGRTALADTLQAQLTAYFAGRLDQFTIPLAAQGTLFTQTVWQALQAVPYGTTRSYAALATQMGAPRAIRAVGRANGANPLAIVIPCHRLLGADGALTGYAGGLWRKEWLIAHERRGLR
jgi:AraC family transcriptional regulator, regulatory protein of adaptative response / methylated-DNA-[protein]-cysteine methyltransferase